ncbi:hypothetical protein RSO01_91010 [Reyranella soli]|uniref:Uncharacterized protein n=1 Tax=Reyranella soli TaxID=1230389 RepID=A0A512NSL8_9HYPH|nr:hypothetical protein RSO01_91010 [Reyranella soli]
MSDNTALASEKREVARRARRLACTLLSEDDRVRLTRFADELDREAAALERSTITFVVWPDVAPRLQTQEQQQSSASSTQANERKEKD